MSIVQQAKEELRRINFGDEDSAVMLIGFAVYFALFAIAPWTTLDKSK